MKALRDLCKSWQIGPYSLHPEGLVRTIRVGCNRQDIRSVECTLKRVRDPCPYHRSATLTAAQIENPIILFEFDLTNASSEPRLGRKTASDVLVMRSKRKCKTYSVSQLAVFPPPVSERRACRLPFDWSQETSVVKTLTLSLES